MKKDYPMDIISKVDLLGLAEEVSANYNIELFIDDHTEKEYAGLLPKLELFYDRDSREEVLTISRNQRTEDLMNHESIRVIHEFAGEEETTVSYEGYVKHFAETFLPCATKNEFLLAAFRDYSEIIEMKTRGAGVSYKKRISNYQNTVREILDYFLSRVTP
jgi:hypothetical protein